jgi:hypothetical protein
MELHLHKWSRSVVLVLLKFGESCRTFAFVGEERHPSGTAVIDADPMVTDYWYYNVPTLIIETAFTFNCYSNSGPHGNQYFGDLWHG